MSFVGGGTDLPAFYQSGEGKVLSCAINKYLYVVAKRQLGIVEHKYRINWSKVEFADTIDEIEHPIVREALRLLEIDFPIEITTFAEVPANTGLGSSSTFAVGLLHALHAICGRYVSKSELASEAARIEIDILNRPIGRQDHYAASYGSLNVFTFNRDHTVNVEPVLYSAEILDELQRSLMMFYTKIKRSSTTILSEQSHHVGDNVDALTQMKALVEPLRSLFVSPLDHDSFGAILDKGWQLKKSQTKLISSDEIDNYYNRALLAGATGGKLLGAGGGGFLLLCAKPRAQEAIRKAMKPLFELPFKVDFAGTRINYYDLSGEK